MVFIGSLHRVKFSMMMKFSHMHHCTIKYYFPSSTTHQLGSNVHVRCTHTLTRGQELLIAYQDSGDEQGATQTTKGIQFFKNHHSENHHLWGTHYGWTICTYVANILSTSIDQYMQEARDLHFVDEYIADKVQEIITSAHQEKEAVLALFNKVLDYNRTTNLTAQMFYDMWVSLSNILILWCVTNVNWSLFYCGKKDILSFIHYREVARG